MFGSSRINYNGNPNLKAIGVNVQYTIDQIKELKKCKNDPIYFIENYCKVVSLDSGLVAFNTYDYQKKFIKTIHENRFTIGMMPRQMGKTATTAAYVLWAVLFNKRYTIGIVANKAAAAKEVLSRVKDMYEQLPIWMQEGVERWNMFDIKLENGSTVFCAATTASGLRGKSINMLVIDEAAIIPNTIAAEFFTSTFPTISSGKKTKVVMISTPLGYNHFWKFWVEAEQGKNGFIPVRVFWYEHPKRDQTWADEQLKILGDVKFAQEVDCAFQGSAYTLISGKALSELAMLKPIQEDEFFRLHEHVKENNVYVAICDPAEGVGGDNSAVTVINISNFPYTIAATYKNNKISSVALPDVIYKLAKEFNDAYVMCEINKFEDVARTLHDEFEYENMIQITHDKRGQVANGGWGNKTKYGVMTTKQVKRLGCATLKQLIETKKLLITDSEVISELSTFIEKKGTYMADEGYTDDLAMTLVLFAWLTTQPLFKELSEKSERKILFNDIITKAKEQLMPFGFFDDGVTNTDEVEEGWVKVDIGSHFY